MIRAIVSSQSCFCWLCRASPSLAWKDIINLISVLAIWWCLCVESSCVVGRGCLLWPVRSLGKTLSLCPASFRIPRPNLPVTPGVSWLPTSPTPGVHSDSSPSSQWCRPAISSSVVPLSSCPQFLPASESFPMSQLFAWGGQRTGVSASASFPPKKSQGWSPSEWTGWISLQSKGLSRVFSNTTV